MTLIRALWSFLSGLAQKGLGPRVNLARPQKTRAAATMCLSEAEHLLAHGQVLKGLHNGVTAQSSK